MELYRSIIEDMQVLPRYWTSVGKAEVDFVIQIRVNIIPVEVKADTRLGGKSLAICNMNYHPAYKVRYSLNNLKMDDGLLNIPFYLADWTVKLLSLIEEAQLKSTEED